MACRAPSEAPHRDCKGHLRIRLHGSKLQGGWTLARMGGRTGEENNWLLIKWSDEHAKPGQGEAFLRREDRSAVTGRTLGEIAAEADRLWTTRPTAKKKKETAEAKRRRKTLIVPDFVPPQLPTLVDKPPEGSEWLHEIKLDGYRMLCRIASRRVQFLTRSGQDWTNKFLALTKTVPTSVDAALPKPSI